MALAFHSIVRQWCKTYKYMLDTPKNRRFYLTDSTAGVVELAKGIENTLSPCVVMESAVEGGGPIAKPSRNYPIYFFVRAKKMADGDEAAIAKEEAWMHAQNFLAWLLKKHNEEMNTNINGDFARINMEDYLNVDTVGPLENGWYAVMIQFERLEPLNMCVDEDLYVECCDCVCEEASSC